MNSIAHFISDMHGFQSLGAYLLVLGYNMVLFNFFKKRKINKLSYTSSANLLMIVGALLIVRLYLVVGIVAVFGIRFVFKRFKHERIQLNESDVHAVKVRIQA